MKKIWISNLDFYCIAFFFSTSIAISASWLNGKIWGSDFGLVKSATVLPKARHRCDVSSKRAVMHASAITRKRDPSRLVIRFGGTQRVEIWFFTCSLNLIWHDKSHYVCQFAMLISLTELPRRRLRKLHGWFLLCSNKKSHIRKLHAATVQLRVAFCRP